MLKECCSPHRYSRPILGNKKTVRNIMPNQMKLFHKNHYIGKNCTLCIAGIVPKEIYSIINNSKLKLLKDKSNSTKINNQITFNAGYKKRGYP